MQQFPPINPAEIAKAMRDGRACDRRHIRIGAEPSFPIGQLIVMAAVAAFIGFALAIGGF